MKRIIRHGWFILLILLAVLFGLAIFHGAGHYYFGNPKTDMYFHFYPCRVFMKRWLAQGIIPFWDPHVFGGCPVLEMQQRGLWYPISFLSILLFPARLSLLVEMFCHVTIGLLLSLFALRCCFRLSAAAAFVGACCYIFGETVFCRVIASHFTVVAVSGWMLLVLGATYRAIDCDRRAVHKWVALAIVASAAMIYAGSPQYVIYIIWAQIFMLLAAFPLSLAWRGVVTFISIWLVAALLSAPQWLPSAVYLPWSVRRAEYVNGLMQSTNLREWLNVLIEFILPMPFGDEVRNSHLLNKSIWELGSHMGAIVLLFMVIALATIFARRRSRRGRLGRLAFGGLGVVVLGLLLCAAVPLPGLGAFREPMKARAVFALGLTLLAAVGAELLRLAARNSASRFGKKVLTIGLCAAFVLLTFYLILYAFFSSALGLRFAHYLMGATPPYDDFNLFGWKLAQQNPAYLLAFILPAILKTATAILCALLLLFCVRCAKPAGRFAAACTALLLFAGATEVFWQELPLTVSRSPFDAAELPQPFIDEFASKIAATRAEHKPLWRVAINKQLPNFSHHMDGFYELSGYDPIRPAYCNIRNVLVGGNALWRDDQGKYKRIVALALGERFDTFDWDPAETITLQAKTVEVCPEASLLSLERNIVAGRLSLDNFGPTSAGLHFAVPASMARCEVGEQVAANDAAILETIKSNVGVTTLSETISIADCGVPPNRYAVDIQTAAPAFLLFRMTWLPGWRVTVDGGAPERPWIANNWMIGIPLESGIHHVVFTYMPSYLSASFVMGGIGLVLLVLIALWRRFRKNPKKITN